jgi:hypothetical protein
METSGPPLDLKGAIAAFSRPFKTVEDLRNVPMWLDALTAAILRNPRLAKKLGAEQVRRFSKSSPRLATLLAGFPGNEFDAAAKAAADLGDIMDASIVDIEDDESVLVEANRAREHLHEASAGLLSAAGP